MTPYFSEVFGNPSSIYRIGQDARSGLDQARSSVARTLNCSTDEVLFTSGATESNNLALNGVAWAALRNSAPDQTPHVITTAIEHHAVLHPAEHLRDIGVAVTVVSPDQFGTIDPDAIEQAITADTCLISVMSANNEMGAIQPLGSISAISRQYGIPLHTDEVQSAGSLPLDVNNPEVDLLTLSAHKFYGPKGVGILYVRKGTPIEFQQLGGGQESGRRAGTENVPLIAGLASALEIAESEREAYSSHSAILREQLWQGLRESIDGIHLNGPEPGALRLPNNLNVAIDGIQGETVLLALDMEGVAVSAGSACTTGNTQPSHVLKALGYSDERCRSSLRLTVGKCNTGVQIDDAIDILVDVTSRIRKLSG